MKTIGIVAEYNPFHLGHAWHAAESRRLAGEESALVAVMSGDYVQRGEPALYSKFARAEAACRSGVDLVVELPLPWALSSAEGFAQGAVTVLAALGADMLSFGSETGNLTELEELAELTLQEEFTERILLLLRDDPAQSFAAARQRLAEEVLGRKLPVLNQPNNILAMEYLKAIRQFHLSITPLAVLRKGAGHDEEGESDVPSASELRRRVRAGEKVAPYLPEQGNAVLMREDDAGKRAESGAVQDLLLLSRLRMLQKEDFLCLPDAADGLGERLYRAVRQEVSYDAVLHRAATRRFPLARVRRLSLCAALGIGPSDRAGLPPYVRVLALNQTGRAVLKSAAEAGRIPILTKPARVEDLGTHAAHVFELGTRAHDFYTLFYPNADARVCGEDWRTGPVICE